jgi:hypothetical protein
MVAAERGPFFVRMTEQRRFAAAKRPFDKLRMTKQG